MWRSIYQLTDFAKTHHRQHQGPEHPLGTVMTRTYQSFGLHSSPALDQSAASQQFHNNYPLPFRPTPGDGSRHHVHGNSRLPSYTGSHGPYANRVAPKWNGHDSSRFHYRRNVQGIATNDCPAPAATVQPPWVSSNLSNHCEEQKDKPVHRHYWTNPQHQMAAHSVEVNDRTLQAQSDNIPPRTSRTNYTFHTRTFAFADTPDSVLGDDQNWPYPQNYHEKHSKDFSGADTTFSRHRNVLVDNGHATDTVLHSQPETSHRSQRTIPHSQPTNNSQATIHHSQPTNNSQATIHHSQPTNNSQATIHHSQPTSSDQSLIEHTIPHSQPTVHHSQATVHHSQPSSSDQSLIEHTIPHSQPTVHHSQPTVHHSQPTSGHQSEHIIPHGQHTILHSQPTIHHSHTTSSHHSQHIIPHNQHTVHHSQPSSGHQSEHIIPHGQHTIPHSQPTIHHSHTIPHGQHTIPHNQHTIPHSQPTIHHSQPTSGHQSEHTIPHSQRFIPHSQHTIPHSQPTIPECQLIRHISQFNIPHSQHTFHNSQPARPHSQPTFPHSQPTIHHYRPTRHHSQLTRHYSQPTIPHSQPTIPHSQPIRHLSQHVRHPNQLTNTIPHSQPTFPHGQLTIPLSQPIRHHSQPTIPPSQPSSTRHQSQPTIPLTLSQPTSPRHNSQLTIPHIQYTTKQQLSWNSFEIAANEVSSELTSKFRASSTSKATNAAVNQSVPSNAETSSTATCDSLEMKTNMPTHCGGNAPIAFERKPDMRDEVVGENEFYKCGICSVLVFDSVSTLIGHYVSQHAKDESTPCPHCREVVEKYKIISHMEMNHRTGVQSRFTCWGLLEGKWRCGVSFDSLYDLWKHLRLMHSQDTKFDCEKCEKQFDTIRSYVCHFQDVGDFVQKTNQTTHNALPLCPSSDDGNEIKEEGKVSNELTADGNSNVIVYSGGESHYQDVEDFVQKRNQTTNNAWPLCPSSNDGNEIKEEGNVSNESATDEITIVNVFSCGDSFFHSESHYQGAEDFDQERNQTTCTDNSAPLSPSYRCESPLDENDNNEELEEEERLSNTSANDGNTELNACSSWESYSHTESQTYAQTVKEENDITITMTLSPKKNKIVREVRIEEVSNGDKNVKMITEMPEDHVLVMPSASASLQEAPTRKRKTADGYLGQLAEIRRKISHKSPTKPSPRSPVRRPKKCPMSTNAACRVPVPTLPRYRYSETWSEFLARNKDMFDDEMDEEVTTGVAEDVIIDPESKSKSKSKLNFLTLWTSAKKIEGFRSAWVEQEWDQQRPSLGTEGLPVDLDELRYNCCYCFLTFTSIVLFRRHLTCHATVNASLVTMDSNSGRVRCGLCDLRLDDLDHPSSSESTPDLERLPTTQSTNLSGDFTTDDTSKEGVSSGGSSCQECPPFSRDGTNVLDEHRVASRSCQTSSSSARPKPKNSATHSHIHDVEDWDTFSSCGMAPCDGDKIVPMFPYVILS